MQASQQTVIKANRELKALLADEASEEPHSTAAQAVTGEAITPSLGTNSAVAATTIDASASQAAAQTADDALPAPSGQVASPPASAETLTQTADSTHKSTPQDTAAPDTVQSAPVTGAAPY